MNDFLSCLVLVIMIAAGIVLFFLLAGVSVMVGTWLGFLSAAGL